MKLLLLISWGFRVLKKCLVLQAVLICMFELFKWTRFWTLGKLIAFFGVLSGGNFRLFSPLRGLKTSLKFRLIFRDTYSLNLKNVIWVFLWFQGLSYEVIQEQSLTMFFYWQKMLWRAFCYSQEPQFTVTTLKKLFIQIA